MVARLRAYWLGWALAAVIGLLLGVGVAGATDSNTDWKTEAEQANQTLRSAVNTLDDCVRTTDQALDRIEEVLASRDRWKQRALTAEGRAQ